MGGYISITDPSDPSTILDMIKECESRNLPDIDLDLNASWHQCPCQRGIGIFIDIINEENSVLDIRLLVSAVSFSSDWRDFNGRPFDYLLLGYIDDRIFTLQPSPSGSYSIEYDWNLPFIDDLDTPNVLIIASVLSTTTGYVYKTTISKAMEGEQPSRPIIPNGPTNLKIFVGYNYTTYSIDPDDDLIRYGWDWNGDYIIDEFTDYYDSGEEIKVMHKWDQKGDYQIRVKAIDGKGMESFWSQPLDVVVKQKKINLLYQPFFIQHHLFKSSFLYRLFSFYEFMN
ncbi:MAG: hypothetical protein DRN12_06815 [Thermoplasmata archaeon]|nr:MAG: hypothetical protein DRN12_06815 [Thermoplasmata archaeon]